MLFKYSILLIGNIKIDITEEELPIVQAALKAKDPCIIIGSRTFAHHQFSTILPIEEANFLEKMRLREKGFWKCRKYGVLHKVGETCACKETGEADPLLIEEQKNALPEPSSKLI